MTTLRVPTFRFLCFGAGAIGTYIGGSLALADHKVVFLERGELAPKLVNSGLSVIANGEERHLDAPLVVSSLEEALTLGPFDAAILAVKSYDTAALLETLAPYKMALPPILCFLNGVDNELRIAEVLGGEKVIPGTVTTAIGRPGFGKVQVERLRGVGLAAEHILAPTLVGVLDASGLRARLYENARAMKWSKMITNLLANASSAILDMAPAEIFAHPRLYRMEVEMLRETLRVMDAQGIPVIDLPATPVRGLSFLVKNVPPSLSQPLLRRVLGEGRGAKMPSFHIDLHHGGARRESEVDFLNGAVVRYGEKSGVPTPVNRVLNQTLLGLTRGEIPLERFAHRPEALLASLDTLKKT